MERPLSASPDPPADAELLRLIKRYGIAEQEVRGAEGSGHYGYFAAALEQRETTRAALLAHIARHYVRRPPVPPLLPTPADVDAGKCRWTEHGWEWTDYRAARGAVPWRPGDEPPEDAIRRLRDDS